MALRAKRVQAASLVILAAAIVSTLLLTRGSEAAIPELAGGTKSVRTGQPSLESVPIAPLERVILNPSPSRRWTIAVVDERSSEPLSGVDILDSSDCRALGKTDEGGRLTLDPDMGRIIATRFDYLPTLATHSDTEPLTLISMRRGNSVIGTVVDQDGEPIAQASVTIDVGRVGSSRRDAPRHAPEPAGSPAIAFAVDGTPQYSRATRSDQSGSFRLDGVPSGSHVLHCMAPGYMHAVDSAQGLVPSLCVNASSGDVVVTCKLRRIYLAAICFDLGDGWPQPAARGLLRSVYRAPEKMQFLPTYARLPDVALAEIRAALPASSCNLLFCCAAADGSHLDESVAGEVVIDCWNHARTTYPLVYVPLNRFRLTSVSHVRLSVDTHPRFAVVHSPVPLIVTSVEPRGFGFDPVSDDGSSQAFLLPDGKFEVLARYGTMLSRKRRQEFEINGDPAMPIVVSCFDGISYLRCSLTGMSAPDAGGSLLINGRRGDIILSPSQADEMLLPCEPGTFTVTFRDDAMVSRASKTVEVGGGTTHCVLEIK